MKIIGVTGGLCTGTSTVMRYIEEKGYPVINKEEIFSHFKLSGIFPNTSPYLELTKKQNTHREIVAQTLMEYIKKKELFFRLTCKGVIFVDVPFLYEYDLEEYFDRVVVVTCGPKTQEERIEHKYNKTANKQTKPLLNKKDIPEILKHQIPIADKRKKCHFVIDNNKTAESTYHQIDTLLSPYYKYSLFYVLVITIGIIAILLPVLIQHKDKFPTHKLNEKLKETINKLKKRLTQR